MTVRWSFARDVLHGALRRIKELSTGVSRPSNWRLENLTPPGIAGALQSVTCYGPV